jgi:hypothetical protein
MAEGVTRLGYRWAPEEITIWARDAFAWAQILGNVTVTKDSLDAANRPRRLQPLGCTTANTFPLGSTNQAAQEWPMSATPSVVTGSGAVYSSIRTP